MAQSSGYLESDLKRPPGVEDGPEPAQPASGKGDDGLMTQLSLSPFALVAAVAASMEASVTGLSPDRRQSSGRDLPPEPSSAARMKTIPALPKQHLMGRAA